MMLIFDAGGGFRVRKDILKTILAIAMMAILINGNVVYAANCDALLTQEAADMISEILTMIDIAVPVLLIILCATDLSTVVISQDDHAIKKATGRIVKRFIAAVAIFFVPLIINVLLGLDEVRSGLNLVDDPLCGINDEGSESHD